MFFVKCTVQNGDRPITFELVYDNKPQTENETDRQQ